MLLAKFMKMGGMWLNVAETRISEPESQLCEDALYFPDMHEKVLETVKTVKTWLLRGLDDHSKICESCCHDNPHVHAEIIDQHIRTRICSDPRSVLVAPKYVASAAFTVCPLA